MSKVDYGAGEREIRCTYYTLTVYEQEFCTSKIEGVTGDLIADVYGRQVVKAEDAPMQLNPDGTVDIVLDFTMCKWNIEKRVLWAMLRTAVEIAKLHGEQYEPVPSYAEWDLSLLELSTDLNAVHHAVNDELQELFRPGAAASR